jgi:hypothetical protein
MTLKKDKALWPTNANTLNSMNDKRKEPREAKFWTPFLRGIVGVFGVVGILTALWWGLDAYLDKQISYKLRDPETIKQIAYLIRPSLIFDQNGNFEIDNGAAQFIKAVDVQKNERGEVQKVTVSPKESLNIQPLLTCLNATIFFQAKREKADWVFEVVGPDFIIGLGGGPEPPEKFLFELQIVR